MRNQSTRMNNAEHQDGEARGGRPDGVPELVASARLERLVRAEEGRPDAARTAGRNVDAQVERVLARAQQRARDREELRRFPALRRLAAQVAGLAGERAVHEELRVGEGRGEVEPEVAIRRLRARLP